MKRLFLLIMLIVLCLSSCAPAQEEPVNPDDLEHMYIVVAESAPGFDAVRKNCFFGYDSWGYLWEFRLKNTADIKEGCVYDIGYNEFSVNKEPTGFEPKVIAKAYSVEEIRIANFSTLPKVVLVGNSPFYKQQVATIPSFNFSCYYKPSTDKTTMSVVLPNGTSRELISDHSAVMNTYKKYADYSSPDEDVYAQFEIETDRLLYVCGEKPAVPLPSTKGSESYYRNWIGEWLSLLGINDFSEYQLLSCETWVDGGENVGRDKYPYLYTTSQETEKIISHTFEYVRYFDGYPTSDTITVSYEYIPVSYEYSSGNTIVRFGTQSFGDVESLSIDEEALRAEAESYVRDGLKDTYELLNIETRNMTLRCCDGRFCMEIDVRLQIVDPTWDDSAFNYVSSVLIFLD